MTITVVILVDTRITSGGPTTRGDIKVCKFTRIGFLTTFCNIKWCGMEYQTNYDLSYHMCSIFYEQKDALCFFSVKLQSKAVYLTRGVYLLKVVSISVTKNLGDALSTFRDSTSRKCLQQYRHGIVGL